MGCGAFLFICKNQQYLMEKVIFTVLFGDTDDLKEPRFVTPGWRYVCYTDNLDLVSPTWEIRIVPGAEDMKRLSRAYKLRPHRLFPEADITLYIDATYRPIGNLDDFIKGKEEGVWMSPHPQREDCFQEGQVIREKRLDDPDVVLDQLGRYRDAGFPDRAGLWRCGTIIRNRGCEDFNEVWWNEVERGSWRDQISCPFAAWKIGTRINPIPHGEPLKYLNVSLHKPYKLTGGVVRVKDIYEIPAVGRDCWVCVGECAYAERAVNAYKRVHCICTKQAYIFPRWLWDYLWDLEKMEKHIMVYGGKLVYWNEE